MFYIIQENLFREPHYQVLIDTLDRMGLGYELCRFIPFVHEIEFKTDRKDVWIFGAVKAAHVAAKYNWTPGSFYNDNHDLEVQLQKYGRENMLNGDGIIMNIYDPLPEDYVMFFARPTTDTKEFSGQVFMNYSWNEWVESTKEIISTDTRVLVAPLKDTQQEVRCWVVDGKVVSTSRYKLGSRVCYENYDHEQGFTDFAQKMVDIYQPAKAFVIDICLYNDEYKIVEINCINCSGFYHVNMQKLVSSLEEMFPQ